MTTPTAAAQPSGSGLRVLAGAASWGLAAAVVAVLVSFLISAEAGTGSLIGGIATVVVLAGGTWGVLKASSIAPAVGLMAALIVFTMQGVLLLVVMAVLARTTDGDQVTAAAFSIIVVTVVWTSLFAVYVRREKIPLFDLSEEAHEKASEKTPEKTPETSSANTGPTDGPGAS